MQEKEKAGEILGELREGKVGGWGKNVREVGYVLTRAN